MEVTDASGILLTHGDGVVLLKSLPVKGGNLTIKKGMVNKNTLLTNN